MDLKIREKVWCCLSAVHEGSGNECVQESLGGSKVGMSVRESRPRRKEWGLCPRMRLGGSRHLQH